MLPRYIFISLILLSVIFGCDVFMGNNAELLITNSRHEEISQVILEYTSSGKNITIGIMKPNSTYRHNVDTHQEDSIKLVYTDSSDVKHEEIAIGYIIKGMKGTTSFVIEKKK